MQHSDSKKNLLVYTSTFPRWLNDAKPPFVYELSRRLKKDFNITVLTPAYPEAEPKEQMENLDIIRFRYFFRKWERLTGMGGIMTTLRTHKFYYITVPFFFLFSLINLIKIIKKTRPVVIHAHWIIPQGVLAIISKIFFKIPVVLTIHGGDIYGLKNWIFKLINKIVLKCSDQICTVSSDIQSIITNEYNIKKPVQIISMGVDSNIFNKKNVDSKLKKKYGIKGPMLLFIGRLAPKKGISYLLEAMPAICKKYPKACLMIIGDGPLRSSLIYLADNLPCTKNIIFRGQVSHNELPAYYATADIFIGPSVEAPDGDKEGLPVTYMEAMASGCPVIGTDLHGNFDILSNEDNGLIIRQRDSNEIFTAVNKILSDKKLKTKIINNAEKTIKEKFDWKIIKKKYLNVLNNPQ